MLMNCMNLYGKKMKLNRLETHDRLLEFNKNTDIIYQGCMDCLRNVPDSIRFPFYIYAHSRQIGMDEQLAIIEDPTIPYRNKQANEKMMWQPRISKPRASSNSYLFLVVQRPDLVKTCWLLPKSELWDSYRPGNMNFNEDIWTSIQNYKYARNKLNEPDSDGPKSEHEAEWRRIFGHEAHKRKSEKQQQAMMDRLYGMESV